MSKFMIKFTYSCGSWARMVKVTDDRTSAVRTLVESLGGSLESMYWDVQSCASYAIADLADPVTAVAVVTAATSTGAFTGVETHVLLTEDQMHDALTLAKFGAQVFAPPGSAAIDPGELADMAGPGGRWPAEVPGAR
jgi:uncharacterized protein with GYD domain